MKFRNPFLHRIPTRSQTSERSQWQLPVLLKKEFRQIFRNKAVLAIVFIAPMVQFIILPLAANFEVKNIQLVVVDHDRSSYSQQMLSRITGSGYFRLQTMCENMKDAYAYVETDKADVILEIPEGFERNLVREGQQDLFIAMNAINGTKAMVGGGYLNTIIAEFNREIAVRLLPTQAAQGIEISTRTWFNPRTDYKLFIIPGLLAILVTMVGGFLAALNIVKEKEAGTIEALNVSPISKSNFILSKLIPFWVLANVVFTNGLILGYVIYDIVPVGSIPLLYLFLAVYLLAVLGLGLLISTFCETQQQAMFIMFFFMMIFVLMGGLFTPINSMPPWARFITHFNPVKYLIEVIRMVMLKGSSLHHILRHIGIILAGAVVLNAWAIFNYRKTT